MEMIVADGEAIKAGERVSWRHYQLSRHSVNQQIFLQSFNEQLRYFRSKNQTGLLQVF